MIKVGLTGGIGSGKSVVAKIFNVLGIPVFDADAVAKKTMETDAGVREGLIAEFGMDVFKDGKLNKSLIASQVFNDSFRLEKLNAIVHPATINAADRWMTAQTTPYVVKEAALLFESGSAGNLDFIVGVFAPVHIRIQRVMERDGFSREEVKARMSRQIDDKIKMRLCDFVINNDEKSLLIPQVISLHEKLLKLSQ